MCRSRRAIFTSVVTAVAVALAPAAAGAAPPRFGSFSLAATPPSPAGTWCPGSALCFNSAAEPAIRATPDGRFFASSENGLGAGTLAWRSLRGGSAYQSLASPNDISAGGESTGEEAGLEPGGGDTDLAIATAKNSAGRYNVYVASLTAANVDVSRSSDDGATWSLNPVTALPIDDREWIAATGAQKVCISYLTAPGILLPEVGYHVDCSADGGTTFLQKGDAYDTSTVGIGARLGSRTGNLAFDPAHPQYLYTIFAAGRPEDAASTDTTGNHVVGIAVSSDGGKTFTDHAIYTNPDPTVSYDNQFPNVAVDRNGTVYAAYSDDHFVYYSFSKNHGTTWSGPYRVSTAGTSVFPWLTAGAGGKVDLVYYKTPYYSSAGPESYPASAAWTVEFAQNLHASTANSAWTRTTATPVVHTGAVCQGGAGCTGNRDLYDDFGVAASPTSGLASIVYSDDQYRNDALNKPASGCLPTATNTSSCDHTAIATQMSGSGIF